MALLDLYLSIYMHIYVPTEICKQYLVLHKWDHIVDIILQFASFA